MKIRLGYACISNALNITSSSTMTYSYYKSKDKDFINDKLDKIIISNFEALKEILLMPVYYYDGRGDKGTVLLS